MMTLSFEVSDELAARIREAAGNKMSAWLAAAAEDALHRPQFDPAQKAAMLAGATDRLNEPSHPDSPEEIQARIAEIRARLNAG
ncbi:hypothetical protein [Catenuloplanes japonicus]|uniref:hypothetical protein n=1 Tax=Catenuloplanes japonicus TaxID=33876 RepID=UPI000526099D|nr:hypothetical protein [Catenuloplanes japonicus]